MPIERGVLLVGQLPGGQRHPVGEVVHRGDLRDVPHLVLREALRLERGEVVRAEFVRTGRQRLGVGADRRAASVEVALGSELSVV